MLPLDDGRVLEWGQSSIVQVYNTDPDLRGGLDIVEFVPNLSNLTYFQNISLSITAIERQESAAYDVSADGLIYIKTTEGAILGVNDKWISERKSDGRWKVPGGVHEKTDEEMGPYIHLHEPSPLLSFVKSRYGDSVGIKKIVGTEAELI